MPQLRRDPVGGRWVIVAGDRAARPRDFPAPRREIKGGFCPFCEGNEDSTPDEVYAVRNDVSKANGPGWQVRVVPNKYPALRSDGVREEGAMGVYNTMTGIGQHEVFIESPGHVTSFSELTPDIAVQVVRTYQQRMRAMKQDGRMVYALIFKNVGESAGASLEHLHSQMICTPVVPKRVGEEMDRCDEYYRFQDECLICRIIQQERSGEERVVIDGEMFVTITPYASRFPFEMWIVPKHHESHYEKEDPDSIEDFGRILHETVRRLDAVLDNPPYNYVLHSAPFTVQELDHFHWHLEVIPRLTHVAGFEWGTGFYINPVMPRQAAGCLREPEFADQVARAEKGSVEPEKTGSVVN
ncbi:MAG: galactose-1-phosphate uridylyltransferase [Candidatus Brocadiia bacterium]